MRSGKSVNDTLLVQVKLFVETFQAQLASNFIKILQADTQAALAEAVKAADDGLKVSIPASATGPSTCDRYHLPGCVARLTRLSHVHCSKMLHRGLSSMLVHLQGQGSIVEACHLSLLTR